MYQLDPGAVYAFEAALAAARSAARIDRMLDEIGCKLSSAEVVTEADIPRMVRERGWRDARVRQGEHSEHTPPDLVFTLWRGDNAPDAAPTVEECPDGTPSSLVRNMLGHGGTVIHHEAPTSGRVCRSRNQFDTIYGCPHGCKYCAGGKVAVIFANVEEFVEREVIPLAERERWQKVFMFNSCLTDILCFEPEYGLSELLVDYYAGTTDQHYLIHTKSANVDFLLDLDHRGHTIVLWSLTSETVSRVIEPGSATTEERIEAARQCREAGYAVRVKFKPIVPVRNWREECERMVGAALEHIRPDNIGLCCVAWMPAEELERIIDVSALEPRFVTAMRDAAEEMRSVITGPLPHEVRAEIYDFYLRQIRRHDPDVPVFLCTESRDMWREFAPRLGLEPATYACGCGPQSPPGVRAIERVLAPGQ